MKWKIMKLRIFQIKKAFIVALSMKRKSLDSLMHFLGKIANETQTIVAAGFCANFKMKLFLG